MSFQECFANGQGGDKGVDENNNDTLDEKSTIARA